MARNRLTLGAHANTVYRVTALQLYYISGIVTQFVVI